MQGTGYLAIWSDLAPEDETDWAHWMTREHAAERVSIGSFLACRVFRAQGAAVNRYFILYELADEHVISAADYLTRLNAPTPWTQRIMPRIRNFVRGGGRVAASAGLGQGGVIAPLRFDHVPAFDPSAATTELARLDRVVAARALFTDAAATSIQTSEKGMRRDDGSFTALLLIEGLDETAVRAALHRARELLSVDDQAAVDALPLYRHVFSLPKRLLPG